MSELPLYLKKHLQEIAEAELFSQHGQFIKCTNHLGEIKWLTETEMENQHEFYPHHLTLFEKIFKRSRKRKKIKVPESEAVNDYIENLKKELLKDIDRRIEIDLKKTEEKRSRFKSGKAPESEKKKDDNYYRNHPDYKLYENHLGERRWLTREEAESQDEFTLEVVSIYHKIFAILKWAMPIIIIVIIAGYFLSPNLVKPTYRGYFKVESNIPLGQLYIDHKSKLGLSLDEPILLKVGT